MLRIMGLVVVGGLILGASSKANAQVAVSVGNPFIGRGVYVGAGAYPAYPAYGGVGYVGAPVVPYAYPSVAVGIGGIGYPAYRPVYGGVVGRPFYGGRYIYRGGYRRY